MNRIIMHTFHENAYIHVFYIMTHRPADKKNYILDHLNQRRIEGYCNQSRPLRADAFMAKVFLQRGQSNLFNEATNFSTINISYVIIYCLLEEIN